MNPIFLHVFPTFGVGGAQTRFAALANHFGPRYRHHIVALDGDYACRERLAPEIDVHYPLIAAQGAGLLGRLRRYRAVLREMKPDLLLTYNWGAIEWAMANAVNPARPLIRHVHIEDGFGPEEQDRQLQRRVVTRRVFLRRSTVVVPSRTLLRIATEIWRLDPARVRYIPNGIAAAASGTAAEPPVFGQPGVPVVGTVSGLRPEKNLGRLLRAFRLLLDEMPAILVIAGDGSERGSLRQLADELGIADRVRFLGHVAQPQSLYDGFDAFALSSDTEQMPITVLEAMAAGLPVVAPDVGDIRNMVAAENTPLITVKDDGALAASLRQALGDAKLRGNIRVANRQKIEREYNEETMFLAYERIFNGSAASFSTG